MARTNNNKYTSINFNHILHKEPLPSSSSSSSVAASYSAAARSHGRMLVLTRPSPKPLTSPTAATTSGPAITTPPLSPAPSLTSRTPDQAPSDPDPNQISLRPLGRTGPGPAPSLSSPVRSSEVASPAQIVESPKPDRFVPPHLRPGFVGREAKPGPDALRMKDQGQRLSQQQQHHHQQQPQQQRQGYFGSPGRYGQNGRPKSGGYERIRTDPDHLGRPSSSGSRHGSSEWHGRSGSRNRQSVIYMLLRCLNGDVQLLARDRDGIHLSSCDTHVLTFYLKQKTKPCFSPVKTKEEFYQDPKFSRFAVDVFDKRMKQRRENILKFPMALGTVCYL